MSGAYCISKKGRCLENVAFGDKKYTVIMTWTFKISGSFKIRQMILKILAPMKEKVVGE